MPKHIQLTFAYALVWLLISWFSLRMAPGESANHLLVAGGLFLVHAALATLIANVSPRVRSILLVPYISASIVLLIFLLLYGTFLRSGGVADGDAVRAVLQTDLQEAVSYLKRLLSPTDLILGLSGALLLIAFFPKRAYVTTGRSAAALIACIGIGGIAVHLGSMMLLVPVTMYAREYRAEINAFESLIAQRSSTAIIGASSDFSGTAVVIIGESTSRHHLGLYGYFRDTTPKLNARDNLIAFTDVISPHSHTVPALTAALTSSGATDERQILSGNSMDIVSLARSSGFNVHWLSNQNEFGVWDNPITVLAKQANQTNFLSSTIGANFQRSSYDADLLPTLRKALSNSEGSRNLIFLHLFTTHWPYCQNYPAEFRRFSQLSGPKFFGNAPEQQGVNCYDDGIRYIDSIVDEVIQALDESSEPAALMYFSDHGEAPLLGTAHESFQHSSYHIEVPLLVWTNEPYRHAYQERISAARDNLDQLYTTARLFHSIAEFLSIKHSSVESQHSVFSRAISTMPRTSLNGKIKYDEWSPSNDYRENASINVRALKEDRPRVWAHRTNSLGALMEAAATFSGIEMDLVFINSSECFHVYHPPAADLSLGLDEMLDAAKRRPNLKLWLDWKNATPQNMQAAVDCLNALDDQFSIRDRSLVETGSDAVFQEIGLISAAGYSHGYYLPTDSILDCMRTCDEAGASTLSLTIKSAVEAGRYSAMTFDWRVHSFIERWLLDWSKERKLHLYSWDMSINVASDADLASEIHRHFSEIDLSALLVTFPTQFGI